MCNLMETGIIYFAPLENSMKKSNALLNNESEKKQIAQALRNILTPNKLISLLEKSGVNDASVLSAVTKASGSKINNKMNVRVVDALVAELAGFNNTHEMMASLKNKSAIYTQYIFNYKTRFGTDCYIIYAPKGYILCEFDVVLNTSIDYDADNDEVNMGQEYGLVELYDNEEGIRAVSDLPFVLFGLELATGTDKDAICINDENDFESVDDITTSLTMSSFYDYNMDDYSFDEPEVDSLPLTSVDTPSNFVRAALKLLMGYDADCGDLDIEHFAALAESNNEYYGDGIVFSTKNMWVARYDTESGEIKTLASTQYHRCDIRTPNYAKDIN